MPEPGRYWVPLTLVLALLIPVGFCDALQASQLVRLARSLEDAPDPMRSDFAWLALAEMVDTYREQATRARRESRGKARWAASVDAYATKMQALADGFTPDTQVRITTGPGNEVYVYVDGHPVIVTGVIDGQQADYEQRVLERFCVLYLCSELMQDAPGAEPAAAPAVAGRADVQWSFSQHSGPVCLTDDGLEFQFRDMQELKRRRRACQQVVYELNEMAAAITRKIDAGVRIDWNGVVIQSPPGDVQHRVLLNPEGATIQLALPALALTPDLFRVLRPWLAARTAGSSYRLVVLNAEHLIEPLMAIYE